MGKSLMRHKPSCRWLPNLGDDDSYIQTNRFALQFIAQRMEIRAISQAKTPVLLSIYHFPVK